MIAIQVPITMLTSTGKVEPATSPHATIGIWASTSRPWITIRNAADIASSLTARAISARCSVWGIRSSIELIIGTGTKDYWSMSKPVNDSQFASFDLNPLFVTIVDSLYSVLAARRSVLSTCSAH